jgi:hypothetical protein
MSGLTGRVATLERQARRAAGCATCGGRGIHIQGVDDPLPSWLGASGCRDCGASVKLVDREVWNHL